MSGTEIEPVGEIPYSTEVLPETEWVCLEAEDGRKLTCTLDHPLYAEEGKRQAGTLAVGDRVIMDTGVRRLVAVGRIQRKCSKWRIVMAEGHLFWANGYLSHNSKPPNQI
jgi:hypothetical protein